MKNHHSARIGLGENAQVDSVWFDKQHEDNWGVSSLTLEMVAKFKNRSDDTVWVKTEISLAPAQAREIIIALTLALQGQTELLYGESKMIERDEIAFDTYDVNLSSKITVWAKP